MKRFAKIGGWFIALSILALVSGCGGGGGGGDSGTTPTPTPTPSPNAQLQGEYFATYYSETTGTLPANIPTATITALGNPTNWAGISPFIVDVDYSGNPYRPYPGTDVTNVYVARDSGYLYCRIDLANGNPNSSKPIYYQLRLRQNPGWESVGDRYLSAYYDNALGWRTDIREFTAVNPAVTISVGNDSAAAGIGSSFIAMRAPLSFFPNVTRRYIYAGAVYLYSTPPDVWDWTDWTDTLDGRFQAIPNGNYRLSSLGTITFDGNGGFTYSGTVGSNAEGANLPDSRFGTYTVNSDGTVSLSLASGWGFGLQKGSWMLVGAAVNDPGNFQGIATLFKKGGSHGLVNRDSNFVSFNRNNDGPFSMGGSSVSSATGDTTSTYTLNAPSGIKLSQISTGTYTRNSDGSGMSAYPNDVYTSNIHTKSIPVVYAGALRDDEKFSVNVQLTNQNKNRQRIAMSITKPTIPPSTASLKGEFFFAAYGYDNVNTRRESVFGTITFDGAGACSITGTMSRSDTGGNQPVTQNGTYSIAADGTGTLTFGSMTLTGALNAEGDIAIASNMTDNTVQNVFIAVKSK